MTIRIATATDVARLLDLDRSSPTAAHWTEAQYADSVQPQRDSARRIVLVAQSENEPDLKGFLVAHHIAPEWELENIVVAASAQRKGIGRQLLDELIARARDNNSEAVFLEVRESNEVARRLYEKAGFRQTGARKSYYQNPLEDAILYRLDIS